MISATIVLVLMIVALVIILLGIVFAFTSILLNYTGRSKSYDRAAVKMSKANDPKPAKARRAKSRRKSRNKQLKWARLMTASGSLFLSIFLPERRYTT